MQKFLAIGNVKTYKVIGNVLFWLFIMVVMIDPTNTILHKKDIVFCLVVAYNMVVYKPDLSKLPYIIMFMCSVIIPYLLSTIGMVPNDNEEVLAVFKSVTPLILLLWVGRYDLVSLARGPVVICCFLSMVIYIAMLANPLVENGVWLFMSKYDFPVMMTRRTILGVTIFTFYLKSFVSFLFVVSYYMYVLMNKTGLNVRNLLFMTFIIFAFIISGTRSTILVPFFLFVVIAFKVYRRTKYVKYIMMPLVFIVAVAFVIVLVAAATEEKEHSNVVKFGHLISYMTLFDAHPFYLVFGQGPGTSFYSEGFNQVVYKTEWSYIELLRCFGVFSLGIIYVFFKPLHTFWKNMNKDGLTYCMFWAYLAYLLIAGTNPLIMSSTGMITLLMAYSYADKIEQQKEMVL